MNVLTILLIVCHNNNNNNNNNNNDDDDDFIAVSTIRICCEHWRYYGNKQNKRTEKEMHASLLFPTVHTPYLHCVYVTHTFIAYFKLHTSTYSHQKKNSYHSIPSNPQR